MSLVSSFDIVALRDAAWWQRGVGMNILKVGKTYNVPNDFLHSEACFMLKQGWVRKVQDNVIQFPYSPKAEARVAVESMRKLWNRN